MKLAGILKYNNCQEIDKFYWHFLNFMIYCVYKMEGKEMDSKNSKERNFIKSLLAKNWTQFKIKPKGWFKMGNAKVLTREEMSTIMAGNSLKRGPGEFPGIKCCDSNGNCSCCQASQISCDYASCEDGYHCETCNSLNNPCSN